MSSNPRGAERESTVGSAGLYRTTLAGPGGTLIDAFGQLECSPQVERVLRHAKRDLLSARVTLSPDEGRGYWELSRIRNDLYVVLSNYSYKMPRVEIVPGDGLLQFNFRVSGDMTYGVSHPGPLRFVRPSLHLWRQPQGLDMREWTAASAHERMVTLNVRPQFLAEYFELSSEEVPLRLADFMRESRSTFDFCEVPLTPQMFDITTKLIDNPYTGALYLTYQEALALELLCATFGRLSSLSVEPSHSCSPRELRALEAARQILMEQLECPPSLGALARSVGLAEKALTQGFKAAYGETVFDFSVRCRMQHALMLLQERQWSVDRVAEAVGYSHPTSFATAFRRRFGLRPIDMKHLKNRN